MTMMMMMMMTLINFERQSLEMILNTGSNTMQLVTKELLSSADTNVLHVIKCYNYTFYLKPFLFAVTIFNSNVV